MFEKVKLSSLPRRERKSESRFERTDDWVKLKKALDKGDLKVGYGLQITLTAELMESWGLKNYRNVIRHIQKYILESDQDYEVHSVQRGDTRVLTVRRPEGA